MNELNKKMLEFAGFKIDVDEGEFYYQSRVKIIYPDGGWDRYEDAPDFTDSLDACFKWLVPKLYRWCIYTRFEPQGERMMPTELSTAEVDAIPNGENAVAMVGYIETAETPALALCRAIEKLIDGSEK